MTSIFPSRVAPAKDASDFQMQHASLKPQRYKTLVGMCHSLGQKGNIKVTTNTYRHSRSDKNLSSKARLAKITTGKRARAVRR